MSKKGITKWNELHAAADIVAEIAEASHVGEFCGRGKVFLTYMAVKRFNNMFFLRNAQLNIIKFGSLGKIV
jgi:hypothetical protein